MRLLIVLVGYALVLLLAGCGHANSEPSGSTRPGSAVLRYAVLGDSYSNGQSAGRGAAWPDQLAAMLRAEHVAVDVVANPSVTGATTAEMLDRGLPVLREAKPDVMTVMLGVNDEVQGHSVGQFTADYDRTLSAAVEIVGDPRRVIAVDIPDYGVTPAGSQFGDPAVIAADIGRFNQVIRTVARHHRVTVVGVNAISRQLGDTEVSQDGLHPSRAQLKQWATHIARVAVRQWRVSRSFNYSSG